MDLGLEARHVFGAGDLTDLERRLEVVLQDPHVEEVRRVVLDHDSLFLKLFGDRGIELGVEAEVAGPDPLHESRRRVAALVGIVGREVGAGGNADLGVTVTDRLHGIGKRVDERPLRGVERRSIELVRFDRDGGIGRRGRCVERPGRERLRPGEPVRRVGGVPASGRREHDDERHECGRVRCRRSSGFRDEASGRAGVLAHYGKVPATVRVRTAASRSVPMVLLMVVWWWLVGANGETRTPTSFETGT